MIDPLTIAAIQRLCSQLMAGDDDELRHLGALVGTLAEAMSEQLRAAQQAEIDRLSAEDRHTLMLTRIYASLGDLRDKLDHLQALIDPEPDP